MAWTTLEHAAMQQALDSARRGAGLVEPNPMVGAVVATPDGTLVSTGCHERFGGPHAEVNALAAAGPAARGGTLFVTLEPCCHHAQTSSVANGRNGANSRCIADSAMRSAARAEVRSASCVSVGSSGP
jgi:pyrimidine deaminase RibD-like protein